MFYIVRLLNWLTIIISIQKYWLIKQKIIFRSFGFYLFIRNPTKVIKVMWISFHANDAKKKKTNRQRYQLFSTICNFNVTVNISMYMHSNNSIRSPKKRNTSIKYINEYRMIASHWYCKISSKRECFTCRHIDQLLCTKYQILKRIYVDLQSETRNELNRTRNVKEVVKE